MPIAPSSRLHIVGYLVLCYTSCFVYFGAVVGIEPTPLSAIFPTLHNATDSVLPLYDTAQPCYTFFYLSLCFYRSR
jgi:hypothetical protein